MLILRCFGLGIFPLYFFLSGRQRGEGGAEDTQCPCQFLFDRSACNELKRLDKFYHLAVESKVVKILKTNLWGIYFLSSSLQKCELTMWSKEGGKKLRHRKLCAILKKPYQTQSDF